MKAGAGPYIMATHMLPPQSNLHPATLAAPSLYPCRAYNIHVPIEIVCSSRSIMKMVINTYICVCICVCVCVRVVACAVSVLIEELGVRDCFQFDIKVQDIAKCRFGLSEHFSKVRKFFPSLSRSRSLSFSCCSFFFLIAAHTMSPQAQLSTCVCVCVWFIYVYFWGLATKCQASSWKLFVCCRVVN